MLLLNIIQGKAKKRLVGFLFIVTNTLILSLSAATSRPASTELWSLDGFILKLTNSSPFFCLMLAFSQKCSWLGYDPGLPQKQINRLLGEICGHVFVLLFI